jgi:hypothetical protein
MFKGKIILRLALLGVMLSGLGFITANAEAAEKVSAKDFCRACVEEKGHWYYCSWSTHGTPCDQPPPNADCFETLPYCEPI